MDTKYIIQQLRKRAAWEKESRDAAVERGDVTVAAWHNGRREALLQTADEIEMEIF